ncbi:MAG: amino acid permease [Rickettsiales bacterium]|nr:amino acid permease [Rickettsiales bacterium]
MILTCLCFFIPSALISAELSSGFPQKGGVFLWIKEAFGSKWGAVAVFMQWITNVPWFVTVLAFMASGLAYAINPALSHNKTFTIIIIWTALWVTTFLNFSSMKLSSFLTTSGVILGVITPSIILITLGTIHIISNEPLAITFSLGALLPKPNGLHQFMLFVGVIMSMTGIEISSVHITQVKNAKKNFSKAIFFACFIIITLYVTGSLSIAIAVPKENISLSAGVMQGITYLCNKYSSSLVSTITSLLISYGAFTTVVTLMIGPSKGVLEAAKLGYFPKFMQKKNNYGMPIGVLIAQAVISFALSFVIIFMPSVSSAFWIMTALSAELYFIMYLLMFAAAIKLRLSKPNIKRPYKIIGGKFGMWVISGGSFITLLLSILFGFLPPSAIREQGLFAITAYISFLLVSLIIFTIIPIILHNNSIRDKKTSSSFQNN